MIVHLILYLEDSNVFKLILLYLNMKYITYIEIMRCEYKEMGYYLWVGDKSYENFEDLINNVKIMRK